MNQKLGELLNKILAKKLKMVKVLLEHYGEEE